MCRKFLGKILVLRKPSLFTVIRVFEITAIWY